MELNGFQITFWRLQKRLNSIRLANSINTYIMHIGTHIPSRGSILPIIIRASVIKPYCGRFLPEHSTSKRALVQFSTANADIHKEDQIERTPIGWAADSGKIEVVEVLIDAGVDVNKAARGEPPVVLAAQDRNREVIKVLIDANADTIFYREHCSIYCYNC